MSVVDTRDRLSPVQQSVAQPNGNGYVYRRPTVPQVLRILKNLYVLTVEFHPLIRKGLLITCAYTLVEMALFFPMKVLLDSMNDKSQTFHEPFSVFMPRVFAFALVIFGLHKILFVLFNETKIHLDANMKKILSKRSVSTLQQQDTEVHMQPWVQTARAEILALLPMVFDIPSYIRSVIILIGFCIILMLSHPYEISGFTIGPFAISGFTIGPSEPTHYIVLIAMVGMGISWAITWWIGILLGTFFHDRQVAFMKLQQQEVNMGQKVEIVAIDKKIIVMLGGLLQRELYSPNTSLAIVRHIVPGQGANGKPYNDLLDDYISKYQMADIKWLRRTVYIRDMFLFFVSMGVLSAAVWYSTTNVITIGTALWLYDLIGQAGQPCGLFSNFQKQLLNAQMFIAWHGDMEEMAKNSLAETQPRQP